MHPLFTPCTKCHAAAMLFSGPGKFCGPGAYSCQWGKAVAASEAGPRRPVRSGWRGVEPRGGRGGSSPGGFWTRAGGRPPSGRAPAPRTWPAHPIGASAPLPAARVRRRGRGAPVCRRRPLCGGPDRAYICVTTCVTGPVSRHVSPLGGPFRQRTKNRLSTPGTRPIHMPCNAACNTAPCNIMDLVPGVLRPECLFKKNVYLRVL